MIKENLINNEILVHLNQCVEDQLSLLKPVEDSWQPSDFLPDLASDDWYDQVIDLRHAASHLSDELLVVLVGNIVTEEALPSYQTWLNRLNGLKDDTGASDTPWGHWARGWTAEENRHGEVLSRYLYLSGRVNMRSFEITTQHLIKNGFDVKSGSDPLRSLVYASFQERATKISHANTGKLSGQYGDKTLSRICSVIASDEARHEEAYKRFFKKMIEIVPEMAIMAFADMMKIKISMPALLMTDGIDLKLFDQFAAVAQRSQIYTIYDYADIIKHLVQYWDIEAITHLSGEFAEAQDYLCQLSDYYLARAERIDQILLKLSPKPFEWIFGRSL